MDLKQLLGDPTPFLDRIFAALERDGVEVADCELDHLCYRVVSRERYAFLKYQLSDLGQLLSESNIGGRPIASFLLHHPIRYRGRKIPVLELPAPKKGSTYLEGYEHVEFVIQQPLEEWVRDYPRLPFDTRGLGKAVNAEVRLQYEGFAVKFHRQSLRSVIRNEKT